MSTPILELRGAEYRGKEIREFFINFAVEKENPKKMAESMSTIDNYDNIVFDLGGVVLDIERDRAVERLDALGIAEADALLDPYCQKGIFLSVEEGKISAGEFFDALRAKSTKADISDKDLEEAFTAFIMDLPVERLQAIRELRRQGKRTYVLSNTNPVMFHTVIDRLFRREGLAINDYFDGVIASFAEKVCKPDPEIFRILLRRYDLDPKKTVFLDDSAKNCAAAEKEGIASMLVDSAEGFVKMLGLTGAGPGRPLGKKSDRKR